MVRKGVDVEWCIISPSKKKFFSVARLKISSKKSVSIRLVLMVIDSPSSLNNAIRPFLILSKIRLFALFIASSLSSLYKPTPLISITVLNRFNK